MKTVAAISILRKAGANFPDAGSEPFFRRRPQCGHADIFLPTFWPQLGQTDLVSLTATFLVQRKVPA